MFYHAGASWLPGGFFGVDVFFVLSGYLITSLLWIEGTQTGNVRLLHFWSRRLRRLYPALLLMLTGVLGYAVWLAEPGELPRLRLDGISTLFYVSNWQFIVSDQSYFEQFNAPSLLLHTWSLAIEEQWYLLWPLVITAVLRTSTRSPAKLVAATLMTAAVSALWMAWNFEPGMDPSRVYYGTDTRAQNLLVGSALAFLHHGYPDHTLPRWSGVTGAAVLLLLMLTTHDHSPWIYRGGFALIAIATALIIADAVQPSGWLRAGLSAPPMRFIGRISYGMYLWHWPIYLMLTPDRIGLDGATLLLLRFAATIVISTLSYHFVESPIRAGALAGVRIRVLGLATVSTMAVLFSMLPVGDGGEDRAQSVEMTPDGGSLVAQSRVRVMIVGDSIAYTLAGAFPKVPGGSIKLIHNATIGCGAGRGDPVYLGVAYKSGSQCDNWPNRWGKRAQRKRPELALVLLGAWEVVDRRVDGRLYRMGTEEYKSYLVREIQRGLDSLFAADTHAVILSTPCMNQVNRGAAETQPGSRAARSRPEAVRWLNAILREIAERNHERATLVDLNEFMCGSGTRARTIDGVELQSDGVHFSKPGGAKVWEWLAPKLIEISQDVRARSSRNRDRL